MTENKKKRTETQKRQTAKLVDRQEKAKQKERQRKAAGQIPPEKLGDRGEQIGEIFSKILELAKCSVDLGINVVSQLTELVKGRQVGSLTVDEGYQESPYHPHPEPHGPAAGSEQTDLDRGRYVTNRTPVFPGGSVRVPCSLNNDSHLLEKKISLTVQEFIGSTQGFQIAPSAFVLEPSEIVIAPVDFEKFVLTGTVPQNAPPDAYYGGIVIDGDETAQIPVVIVVTTPVADDSSA